MIIKIDCRFTNKEEATLQAAKEYYRKTYPNPQTKIVVRNIMTEIEDITNNYPLVTEVFEVREIEPCELSLDIS